LTLRQLYYQFVVSGRIPNTKRSYKRLASIVNDGRLVGLIDWNAIKDRTRNLQSASLWDSPAQMVKACATQYRIDRWAAQKSRLEVWIEKDALIGVIESVCDELDVPYFACRGYVSQSEQWRAGQRFIQYARKHKQHPVVIHLGDHDPSGLDMTRDNDARLCLFGADVTVRRIALNMDQIDQYSPPPNPTKVTDSRAEGYIAKFGTDSWELDALEPAVIQELVRGTIMEYLDEALWQEAIAEEQQGRDRLAEAAEELDR
ncbi:MAG: hypothetical protein O7D34_07990, partial [Ignavibacteria bacterium]|nr:hypothetical protein [Ignavibacteria bacterium]